MSNHERFIRRTKDKIGRAGIRTLIGAVDWSFNEIKGKNRKRWSRHIHGVIPERGTEADLEALKNQFPESRDVRKPVYVVPWDGEPKALRYLVKQPTKRRISFMGKRFDKASGKHRKCRDTDKQPLRSRDRLELLLHLDDIGIAGRLFLKGVQFINRRDKGPTFVDRQSQARARETDGKGNHV
jgi:hypothetical protein